MIKNKKYVDVDGYNGLQFTWRGRRVLWVFGAENLITLERYGLINLGPAFYNDPEYKVTIPADPANDRYEHVFPGVTNDPEVIALANAFLLPDLLPSLEDLP